MSEKFPSQMQDKFTVRFPDGLRDAIADRAKRNGRSMNSEIVQILEDAVSSESLPNGENLDMNQIRILLDKIANELWKDKKPT
ncbi:Arc family DNA-binding protein [Salmonella enterica]|nr:Arc family DNA-binding protein [Salmonella enterica]EBO9972187.1 Arc family DNA-binding protein [Salmonella enterica]EBP3368980.1 Arc family DNA-binding protein [Salmonella enterica]